VCQVFESEIGYKQNEDRRECKLAVVTPEVFPLIRQKTRQLVDLPTKAGTGAPVNCGWYSNAERQTTTPDTSGGPRQPQRFEILKVTETTFGYCQDSY
jgi:hypothetical protein